MPRIQALQLALCAPWDNIRRAVQTCALGVRRVGRHRWDRPVARPARRASTRAPVILSARTALGGRTNQVLERASVFHARTASSRVKSDRRRATLVRRAFSAPEGRRRRFRVGMGNLRKPCRSDARNAWPAGTNRTPLNPGVSTAWQARRIRSSGAPRKPTVLSARRAIMRPMLP
jgi:hypothetical protein